MARADLRDLYHQLTTSKFGFVGNGEHSLEDVYRAVKTRFPALCDDGYLCRDNCAHGHDQPEWRHTVRKALNIRSPLPGLFGTAPDTLTGSSSDPTSEVPPSLPFGDLNSGLGSHDPEQLILVLKKDLRCDVSSKTG